MAMIAPEQQGGMPPQGPPQQGGMPPELMQMLMAGGGPPGAGGPPQGPPQEQGPQFGSSAELIAATIDLLRGYPEVEQDQEDLAVAAQVIAALQKLLAKQQREADTATGVGPAARFLRRG